QAAGTPVIAYNQGGAREWMTEPVEETKGQSIHISTTGILFDSQTVEGLQTAVTNFLRHEMEFSASDCRQNAERFSTGRFQQSFRQFVELQTGETIKI
ncbi:MAG: glycosyltransferase family 4 protein, partial [FCB group bacterium]|nr:glycosyltransferase family 4 protein [FCB group bacterium]